jgi:hypothetical protein
MTNVSLLDIGRRFWRKMPHNEFGGLARTILHQKLDSAIIVLHHEFHVKESKTMHSSRDPHDQWLS